MAMDGRFIAEGCDVHRNPLEIKNDDGSSNIRIGFRVCTISPFVDDDTASTIAAALNRLLDSGDLS